MAIKIYNDTKPVSIHKYSRVISFTQGSNQESRMDFYRNNQVTINYIQQLVNKQLPKPVNLHLTLWMKFI